MKVTEVTPKTARLFNVELNEKELKVFGDLLGGQSDIYKIWQGSYKRSTLAEFEEFSQKIFDILSEIDKTLLNNTCK